MNGTILVILIGVGGAVGAVGRHLFTQLLESPWGTAAANLVACFALGLVTVSVEHPVALPVAAAGLLGGMSTFSTFCADLVALVKDRDTETSRWQLPVGYLVISVIGGIGALTLGGTVGTWL